MFDHEKTMPSISSRPRCFASDAGRIVTLGFSAAGVLAIVVGCSGGDRPMEPSDASTAGAPIPLEQFCAEYAAAVCDRTERCGCGAAIVSECRTRLRDECAAQVLDREVQSRLASGVIRYDAAAAGRLVARIRSTTGCGTLAEDLGLTFADIKSVGGVFAGTKGVMERCTEMPSGVLDINECFGGGCILTLSGSVCKGPVTVGSPCDGEENETCVRTDVPVTQPSLSVIQQRLGLFCSPDTNRCQAKSPLGASCTTWQECESSHCSRASGRCEPPLADGQACELGVECASAYCEASAAGSTCRPRHPDGSPCVNALFNECASGVCMMGRCVPGACRYDSWFSARL
jgi:hypothetical protein